MLKLVLCAAVVFSLVGCNSNAIKGSGKITTNKREMQKFKTVQINGDFNVNIVAQKKQDLAIIGDDNVVPRISTEVKEGTLYVRLLPGKLLKPSKTPEIVISVAELNKIKASGGSKIRVMNLKSDQVNVKTSGNTQLDIAGVANTVRVKSSGSAQTNAQFLEAKNVKVKTTDTAKTYISASNVLDVNVSDSGRVQYTGNPKKIIKDIKDSGKVSSIE